MTFLEVAVAALREYIQSRYYGRGNLGAEHVGFCVSKLAGTSVAKSWVILPRFSKSSQTTGPAARAAQAAQPGISSRKLKAAKECRGA